MNIIVCLIGPSGVGKSSYIKRLTKHFRFTRPAAVTTRKPRKDDEGGYRYVTKREFKAMVKSELFVEWDFYQGSYYGTPWQDVLDLDSSSFEGVVLDLTPSGYLQVRKKCNNVVSIALLPNEKIWLKETLKKRNSNSKEDIALRTQLLDDYIEEVEKLKIPTVICYPHSSTWDDTFAEIVDKVLSKR